MLRFPSEGILVTSTSNPNRIHKERVFYVDADGKRLTTPAAPRVERFDGSDTRGRRTYSHTILFIGGNAPVDHETLDIGTQKASDVISRLHPNDPLARAEPESAVNQPDDLAKATEFAPLKSGWNIKALAFLGLLLFPYVSLTVVGAWWFLRAATRAWKESHPTPHRILLAAYLAVVFTPSIIGDFWLIAMPGPAFIGLTAFTPAILFSADRAALLNIVSPYYILPMLAVFTVSYVGLSVYARIRARRASHRA